jgi:hypothetical protein
VYGPAKGVATLMADASALFGAMSANAQDSLENKKIFDDTAIPLIFGRKTVKAIGALVVACVVLGVMLFAAEHDLEELRRAVADGRDANATCRDALERTSGELDTYKDLLGVAARHGRSAVGGPP